MSFFSWLFGKKPAPQREAQSALDDELSHWRIAEIENAEQGVRAIARIRVDRPALPNLGAFTTAATVSWRYDSAGHFPDPETQAAMDRFEVAAEDLSADNGYAYLIQVRTGLGERTWLYYTADVGRFTAELEIRLRVAGDPPVRVETSDDPDWSRWRELADVVKSR